MHNYGHRADHSDRLMILFFVFGPCLYAMVNAMSILSRPPAAEKQIALGPLAFPGAVIDSVAVNGRGFRLSSRSSVEEIRGYYSRLLPLSPTSKVVTPAFWGRDPAGADTVGVRITGGNADRVRYISVWRKSAADTIRPDLLSPARGLTRQTAH